MFPVFPLPHLLSTVVPSLSSLLTDCQLIDHWLFFYSLDLSLALDIIDSSSLKTQFWLLWYNCLLIFFFAPFIVSLVAFFLNANISVILILFEFYLTLNFPCSVCFEGFSFSSLLSLHTLIHTHLYFNSDLTVLEYILITYCLDLNVTRTSQAQHIPNWFFTPWAYSSSRIFHFLVASWLLLPKTLHV